MAKGNAVLKFRIRANSQSKTSTREGVKSFAENFANILVNQVVVLASDAAFAKAKQRLTLRITAAVNREIGQMAQMVNKFLVQPPKAKGPAGVITAADRNTSDTFSQQGVRWNYGQFDLAKSGVTWKERTYNYMMWKYHHKKPEDWWKLTGKLQAKLGKESFYTQSFGPVTVQFIRSSATGPTDRITTLGGGRPTATKQIGTVSVSALGRISGDMLPSLATGDPFTGNNPRGTKLTSLIKDKSVAQKLQGRGEYRPVLEPFLSYYLTRAIPNSVFRVTEKLVSAVSIRDDISKTVGNAGKGSTGLNF